MLYGGLGGKSVAADAGWRRATLRALIAALWCWLEIHAARANGVVLGPPFRFDADTFSFANETVYLYPEGHAEKRVLNPGDQPPAFTLHCFVMSRAAEQFRNFARLDPALPPPDDRALARLVRQVTRRAPWRNPLPPAERIVIPGYASLRALSQARPLILQRNIGTGWTVYARVGNWRMFGFFLNGRTQQGHTQRRVEQALRRNDLFIAYLTHFPSLAINHAVAIYGHRADSNAGTIHYLVYDPNHPEAPRDLAFDTRQPAFSLQKDRDFVGGKVTVLLVYNNPLQ